MGFENGEEINPEDEPPPRVSDTTVSAVMGVIAVGGTACAIGSAWSAAEAQEIIARGERAIELALGGVGVSD